ncbi:MAG: helix-turn-helix domain-containing protein [Saprospiraceae bacterium]
MLTVNFDDERLFKVIQDAVRSVILENPSPPSASADNQKLLTRKEAADLAGVCLATVDNKVKSGVLKKYRTGGIVRFRHQEVVEAFTQSLFDNSKRAATARSKKS